MIARQVDEDRQKLIQVIRSCLTKNHLLVCEDMITAWVKKHKVRVVSYRGGRTRLHPDYAQVMRIVEDRYRIIEAQNLINDRRSPPA